jgi:endonuclease YncB( thermonuclease family)
MQWRSPPPDRVVLSMLSPVLIPLALWVLIGMASASAAKGAAEGGAAAICTAVSVWDGDGPVACREGWRLRLHGIAARELDGTCRKGHPCPTASGVAARTALVALLGGEAGRAPTGHVLLRRPARLRCIITGGSYGRLTAWCTLPDGRDLSCAMIASGTALRWARHWGSHRCPTD